MLQYNPSISGSLSVTGSVIVTNGLIGTVNGVDVQIFSSSISQVVTNIQTTTGSQSGRLTSIESFTSSTSARLNSIETHSASVDTLNTIQNTRLTNLEQKTGSLATTGSNTFYGNQTISGTLYVQNDLIVQGSSSLQNITASAVSIGTNIVSLNTATPSVRYAGLTVQDSGSSAGVTGSILWDSLCNKWIYSNPSTVGYSGGMLMSGPRNTNSIGEEVGLTSGYLAVSNGSDHISSSAIFHTSSITCFYGNSYITPTNAYLNGDVGLSSGNIIGWNGFSSNVAGNGIIGGNTETLNIYTCGTSRMTIGCDGFVGVNCTTLNNRMFVVRNSCARGISAEFIASDANNSIYIAPSGSGGTNMISSNYVGAGPYKALSLSGRECSTDFVLNNGKVGIGTSTPGALLAVQACSGTDAFGVFMGGAGTTCGGIKMGNDGSTYGSLYFDNATNDVLLLQQYSTGNLRFGTNSSEKMRITTGGCIIVCNNTLPLATPSVFGYSAVYQVLILGNTNKAQSKSIAFGVDVSGNNSGAFSGYGDEYIWRCAGSFITPNTTNNGYNTIFSWNGGGCTWFNTALGVGLTSPTSTLHVKSVNDGFRLESACARGTGQIYFSFGDPTGRKGYLGYGSSTSDLLVLSNDMNAPVAIYTNDTKRVNIANSGEVTFCCQICTPGISVTSNPIGIEYLIIAGGGGGGWDVGGGGGAGGVLNDSIGIWPGTYNIGIGAGGPGKSGGGGVSTSQNGYNTYAIGLMAIGGGGGGNYSAGIGSSGGSGGGGAGYGATTAAGFGMKGQGFEGGCGINVSGYTSTGGGGGGAGGVGQASINNLSGYSTGGTGIISTIIGEHRSYGCGGRGGGDNWSGPMNTGTANTGNGGDGAGVPNEGCAGGSGIVILKMKNTNSATFSGGLTTYTCTNVACYNIYVVTAGAGTVTIS